MPYPQASLLTLTTQHIDSINVEIVAHSDMRHKAVLVVNTSSQTALGRILSRPFAIVSGGLNPQRIGDDTRI